MGIIKDFPSRYLIKVANEIMLNEKINKMMYYNSEDKKDIYSLPEIENPIKELKDKKVFINRRINEILLDADISVFVNVYRDFPYTNYYKSSRTIQQCKIEVGVVCHNDCRFTLNGLRDAIVYKEIQKIFKENKNLMTIGFPTLEQTYPMYNMPYEYVGYASVFTLEYFESM